MTLTLIAERDTPPEIPPKVICYCDEDMPLAERLKRMNRWMVRNTLIGCGR